MFSGKFLRLLFPWIKSKVPVQVNAFRFLQPHTWMLRALGVLPCSVESNHSVLEHSYVSFLYCIIWLVGITYVSVQRALEVRIYQENIQNTVMDLIFLMMCIAGPVSRITFLAQRKQLMHIMETINAMNDRFNDQHRLNPLWSWLQLAHLSAAFLAIPLRSIWYSNSRFPDDIVNFVQLFLFICFYYDVLKVVSALFEQGSLHILHQIDKKSSCRNKNMTMKLRQSVSVVIPQNYIYQIETPAESVVACKNRQLSDALYQVEELYIKLDTAVTSFIQFTNTPLLLECFYLCISLTGDGFHVIQSLTNDKKPIVVYFAVTDFVRSFLLFSAPHHIQCAVDKVAEEIARCIGNNEDIALTQQAMWLWLRLKSTKTISIFGMINLSRTCLVGIATFVLTYIVLLLQVDETNINSVSSESKIVLPSNNSLD